MPNRPLITLKRMCEIALGGATVHCERALDIANALPDTRPDTHSGSLRENLNQSERQETNEDSRPEVSTSNTRAR